MYFSLKTGVRIAGLQPEMALAATIVAGVFAQYERSCEITSAVEGKHGYGSLHLTGNALDFGIKSLGDTLKPSLVADKIRQALGKDFDVVLEETHIHIEFQPKTGINL